MLTTSQMNQKSIFVSLMRYSPETSFLRERIVDDLVLTALIETNVSESLSLGPIQSKIELGPTKLRQDIIKDSLSRLESKELISKTIVRKKCKYHIQDKGKEKIQPILDSSNKCFQHIIDQMANNIDGNKSDIISTFRTIISSIFAKYGREIADSILGHNKFDTKTYVQIDSIIEKAFRTHNIEEKSKESIKAHIYDFFRSKEKEIIDFKHHLTQGYFFAQLLELSDGMFNSIIIDAFKGSILYLDTNVIMSRFIIQDETSECIDELIRLSKELNITLVVSKVTINELKKVAADRKLEITNTLEKISSKVLRSSTNDEVVLSYFSSLETDPNLTLDDFLKNFDNPESFLEGLGINIDHREMEDIFTDNEIETVRVHFKSASEQKWGYEKSDNVANHDATLFKIVEIERNRSNNAWFLSRDSSLCLANQKYKACCQPFYFLLNDFLQSISPYVANTKSIESFQSFLSKMMSKKIPSTQGNYFSISELQLITNLHEDVLSTPDDTLVLALNYIKKEVLKGHKYTHDNYKEVSLELKKYINASKDNEIKVVSKKYDIQADRLQDEISKREKVEEEKSNLLNEKTERDIESSKKDEKIEKLRMLIKIIFAFFLTIIFLLLHFFSLNIDLILIEKFGSWFQTGNFLFLLFYIVLAILSSFLPRKIDYTVLIFGSLIYWSTQLESLEEMKDIKTLVYLITTILYPLYEELLARKRKITTH